LYVIIWFKTKNSGKRYGMKVLILNGSPRPDGDTAQILRRLKDRFPRSTDVETIDAFEEGIRPCSDCRYCWENEGCCIRDGMDLIAKDDYDVVVLASPLYMSFVTPPLFSVISRLNAIWSNRYFGIRTEPESTGPIDAAVSFSTRKDGKEKDGKRKADCSDPGREPG
jgi:multimeric flavodoxin WrbA